MCTSQNDRQRWISDLNKIHRQLVKSENELSRPFAFYEIYDPQMILVKSIICAKIIDRQRILFGTDDGLYCGELSKDEFVKITDKRVSDIRLCTDVDIIAIISGNRRTVRLFPIAAAITGSYDQEPPKLEETRGCTHLATGNISTDVTRIQNIVTYI